MALQIQTTGVEQYADGSANIKALIIGGPGAGKTREASFWPSPIYADCEAGLASVADRKVPFASIKTSQDMLDFLAFLKRQETKWPNKADRPYQTAVIDTLDAFQRKVKDEYLLAHPDMDAFRGFDAWGYLDAKMQMLMTRLLNLDMNVLVLVHYKDKVTTEGSGRDKQETHQLMLQLSGDIKDSAFNDFDLVGWMGTYWAAENGERVEKRGLTFKATPDKPFLKDRFFITPPWMEVTFSEADYVALFEAYTSKLDGLGSSEVVEEIPSYEGEAPVKTDGVVDPKPGGAVPPQDPKDMPYDQIGKPELLAMARAAVEAGKIPADQVKSNTLKGDLVKMLTDLREREKAEAAGEGASAPAVADGAGDDATPVPLEGSQPTEGAGAAEGDTAPAESDSASASPDAAPEATSDSSTPVQDETPGQAAARAAEEQAAKAAQTPVAGGNPAPEGEKPMTPEQVAEAMGGATVVSEGPDAETPKEAAPPPPPPAPPAAPAASEDNVCAEDGCSQDLTASDQNPDYVKLSFIKFRKKLCNEHYAAAKAASR